jgi:L-fucose isomerase-like protein
MANGAEVFRRVVERLSGMTPPKNRAFPITEDTEVYRDLEIYGDEIVDLVWWLEREFGVTTNVDPFKYAPREYPFFQALKKIKKIIGIERQYKSLRVRDIIAVIEAKCWPEEASSYNEYADG